MKLRSILARFGLVVTAASALGVSAMAQEAKVTEKKVPAAVIAAFKTAYPQATIRGYAKEKENGKVYYEIESMEGQTTRDVLYNPDGTVAEIEESIALSDLPTDAQEAIRSMSPKAVVTKVEKLTRADVTEYEAHAKQGKKRIELKFDASGKPLKKG
jgi:uncharacterized membrane protein YkoI